MYWSGLKITVWLLISAKLKNCFYRPSARYSLTSLVTGIEHLVSAKLLGVIPSRIISSCPTYSVVRVVRSVLRSDHRAVLAYQERSLSTTVKERNKRTFRRRTPTQHAQFLQYVSTTPIENHYPSTHTQDEFDIFYATALQLLDQFYPECSTTVTSRDPDYVTPEVKALLRRKNRLMRLGRIEEASAIAKKVGHKIENNCRTRLNDVDGRMDLCGMQYEWWQAVGKNYLRLKV